MTQRALQNSPEKPSYRRFMGPKAEKDKGYTDERQLNTNFIWDGFVCRRSLSFCHAVLFDPMLEHKGPGAHSNSASSNKSVKDPWAVQSRLVLRLNHPEFLWPKGACAESPRPTLFTSIMCDYIGTRRRILQAGPDPCLESVDSRIRLFVPCLMHLHVETRPVFLPVLFSQNSVALTMAKNRCLETRPLRFSLARPGHILSTSHVGP